MLLDLFGSIDCRFVLPNIKVTYDRVFTEEFSTECSLSFSTLINHNLISEVRLKHPFAFEIYWHPIEHVRNQQNQIFIRVHLIVLVESSDVSDMVATKPIQSFLKLYFCQITKLWFIEIVFPVNILVINLTEIVSVLL